MLPRATAAILGCLGRELSREEAAFFREARPLGFILFARNVQGPAQLARLCADLREAVGWQAPILVDQEGGRVQRLGPPAWRHWRPPLDTVAEAGPHRAARAMYLRARLIAHEHRALGIDVNCAPLADLARPDTHPFLRNRLYGTEVAEVVENARAVAEGLLDGGVLPVLKHMPGHGRATQDSHLDLPRVRAPRAMLEAGDFAAFRPLNRLPMGMTAHVVYEAIDPDAPATLSERTIRLIRDEIGFDGLLMTDDLSMNALPGPISERAAQARVAGVDVILHCNGEPAEMRDVVLASGPLEGDARRRAEAAIRARREPEPLDIAATEAELDGLLNGRVYG